jgi:hypothetical protein
VTHPADAPTVYAQATNSAAGNSAGRSRAAGRGAGYAIKSINGTGCVICGGTHRLQVHHRVPLADGGTNTLDNLELRCRTHHTHAPTSK